VAPLLSWYDSAFDTHDATPGRLRFDRFCQWPVSDLDVWQVMLRLNTPYLVQPPRPALDHHERHPINHHHSANSSSGTDSHSSSRLITITASHFLPHPTLPSSPAVPELRKAVGCSHLLSQLAALGSSCHVYGHTHINGSVVLTDPPPQPPPPHRPLHNHQPQPSAAAAAAASSSSQQREQQQPKQQQPELQQPEQLQRRQYVQYALEGAFDAAAGGGLRGGWLPGLVCVWDGSGLTHTLVDVRTGAELQFPSY